MQAAVEQKSSADSVYYHLAIASSLSWTRANPTVGGKDVFDDDNSAARDASVCFFARLSFAFAFAVDGNGSKPEHQRLFRPTEPG